MTRLGFVLIAIAAAAGCGNGGTHVDGTIKGGTFAASDAISAVFTQSAQGVSSTSATILVSTTGGVCDVISGGHAPAGSQSLVINLFDVDAKSGAVTAPSAAGTYTVATQSSIAPHSAGVAWISLDKTCAKTQALGVSGTVTLSSASSNGYAGSFDLTLDSGDHVTGHFDSTSCNAFGAELAGMTDLPCG